MGLCAAVLNIIHELELACGWHPTQISAPVVHLLLAKRHKIVKMLN